MEDMTELEIINFALDFGNLIKQKNSEIVKLQAENQRLSNEVLQLRDPGRKLSEEEIRKAQRPVFVRQIPQDKRLKNFYAVPLSDGSGVIGPTKGVYRFENYLKTWEAFSEKPAEGDEI